MKMTHLTHLLKHNSSLTQKCRATWASPTFLIKFIENLSRKDLNLLLWWLVRNIFCTTYLVFHILLPLFETIRRNWARQVNSSQ